MISVDELSAASMNFTNNSEVFVHVIPACRIRAWKKIFIECTQPYNQAPANFLANIVFQQRPLAHLSEYKFTVASHAHPFQGTVRGISFDSTLHSQDSKFLSNHSKTGSNQARDDNWTPILAQWGIVSDRTRLIVYPSSLRPSPPKNLSELPELLATYGSTGTQMYALFKLVLSASAFTTSSAISPSLSASALSPSFGPVAAMLPLTILLSGPSGTGNPSLIMPH